MEPKSHLEVARLTEEEARAYLESIRWPTGAACPRCGSVEVTKLQGRSTRPGVYKCRGCRKPFTVTVGTIFEDSHIPLSKWVLAFHMMCSSKKGVSALQLQRTLALGSYKSAWHMAHRIRHAMRSEPLAAMLKLSGIVEVDETFVGGKPRKGVSRMERGWVTKKEPVVVLVERDGEARAMSRARLTGQGKGLRDAVRENVERSARVMTDDGMNMKWIGREFASHETTNHLAGEYARGDVHSNTAESFFALVKRSVHGIHHHISKRHMDRYLAERCFVWNGRKVSDSERTLRALQGAEGKRLLYEAAKAEGG
jgi:transposase-like protein